MATTGAQSIQNTCTASNNIIDVGINGNSSSDDLRNTSLSLFSFRSKLKSHLFVD